MQGLLGGVGHHGVLAVDLPLGQNLHHLLSAALAADGNAAEALALAIGPVFVELDLDKVSHPDAVDRVLNINK